MDGKYDLKDTTMVDEKILELLNHEKSLTQLCTNLNLNKYEVLGIVNRIRESGQNIVVKRLDDDIYLINQGEREMRDGNSFNISTDDTHEFKFIAFSDPRLGSKSEQLTILNDLYKKAYDMGYTNAILCGNISAGLYPITDIYAETNFIDDTNAQVEYIVKNYPYIEGMTTYFITGKVDDTHLKKNKINIGKRISQLRDDMIYLGENSCDLNIDNTRMQVLCSKLGKTYTVSYRTQQQVDSYRSEDKPDILLHGGLLQMEKFTDRNVKTISVPSVVATTKEMNDKRYSNTIGAWFVTIRTDKKGLLESVRAINCPYYVTKKDDYHTAKPLRLVKKVEE